MTFTQIRNYIKGLFNPIIDELKQNIEDANGVVPINFDDFNHLSQSERDNGKAYFIPDVNFNNQKRPTPTGFTPIGTIISVMGNHAPSHYLICDGTTYNISDYPDLADYFEKEFGTKNKFGGDGTTTFAVPDLRGEFLRGTGTNSHENQGSGADVGTHQDATLHFPVGTTAGVGLASPNVGPVPYTSAPNQDSKVGSITSAKGFNTSGTSTWSASSVKQYTSRPTNTSVLYCIATCNIYIDAKHNYSTQETVIGTWIDGKPIYQKTVLGTVSNYTSINRNPIGASVDTVVKIDGMHFGTTGACNPIAGVTNDSMAQGLAVVVVLNSSATNPNTYAVYNKPNGQTTYVGHSYYLTIQYTKTTD